LSCAAPPSLQLQVRRQLHAALREAARSERLAPEAASQLYALSARIEKPLHAGRLAGGLGERFGSMDSLS
jgi:hypothetical protein